MSDIPSWLQSLTPDIVLMSICEFLLISCGIGALVFFVVAIIFEKSISCAMLSTIFVSSVVSLILISCDISNLRYAESVGLQHLRGKHFVISQYEANKIFDFEQKEDTLKAYTVGVSPAQKLQSIPGDVHIIATTKDYHYATYFTVVGLNGADGKPIVWMTSTRSILLRYGAVMGDSNTDVYNPNNTMKSFENAHKIMN